MELAKCKNVCPPGVHPTVVILVVNPVDDIGQNYREGEGPAEDDQYPGYPLLVTVTSQQEQSVGSKN